MLFREGRKLVKAGKLEEGCARLEASQKIEPSTGTLLNLGDCREKLGEYASAWAAFRRAEAMAKRRGGDEKRRNEAAKRAIQLEPKLSYLAVIVSSKIDGLVIRRDDEVIDPVLWNSPIPVDPDQITIVAEAPGHRPWRTKITFDNTRPRRQTVTVPALERAPNVAPERPAEKLGPTDLPPVAVRAPPPRTVVVERTTPPTPSLWTTQRKVAIGVGVGGAIVLGAGVYFGLRSNDLESTSNEICPMSTCDDPEGLRLNDRAQTAARNANISYAVGGLMLATSGVLWLLGGPDELRVEPNVGADHAGVSIGGRF